MNANRKKVPEKRAPLTVMDILAQSSHFMGMQEDSDGSVSEGSDGGSTAGYSGSFSDDSE